jgi:hypothetical protein
VWCMLHDAGTGKLLSTADASQTVADSSLPMQMGVVEKVAFVQTGHSSGETDVFSTKMRLPVIIAFSILTLLIVQILQLSDSRVVSKLRPSLVELQDASGVDEGNTSSFRVATGLHDASLLVALSPRVHSTV